MKDNSPRRQESSRRAPGSCLLAQYLFGYFPIGRPFIASLSCVLALVAWALIDNSFLAIIDYPWDTTWSTLQPRRLLFVVVVGAGLSLLCCTFIRLWSGDIRARSLRSYLLATGLVAAWMAFVVSYERIASTGTIWAARRLLPSLKMDAKVLCTEWPSKDGVLPYLGKYHAYHIHTDLPTTLAIESWFPQFRLTEVIGPTISQGAEGRIRFDWGNEQCAWIEYRPDQDEVTRSCQLLKLGESDPHDKREVIELEHKWFLVRGKRNTMYR